MVKMKKEDLIKSIKLHIESYEYDLKNDDELMNKKRTNKDIAKQCIANYKMVLKTLEDLE